MDQNPRPEFDVPDGDAALIALSEWLRARAPQVRQELRSQAQLLHDAMAAVGEVPSFGRPAFHGRHPLDRRNAPRRAG
jgi:hypothetical protein